MSDFIKCRDCGQSFPPDHTPPHRTPEGGWCCPSPSTPRTERMPWQQVEGPCVACGRMDCSLVKQWKSEAAYQACLEHAITRARASLAAACAERDALNAEVDERGQEITSLADALDKCMADRDAARADAERLRGVEKAAKALRGDHPTKKHWQDCKRALDEALDRLAVNDGGGHE